MNLSTKIQNILKSHGANNAVLQSEIKTLIAEQVALAHDQVKVKQVEGVWISNEFINYEFEMNVFGFTIHGVTTNYVNIRDRHGRKVGQVNRLHNKLIINSDQTYDYKGHKMINVRIV